MPYDAPDQPVVATPEDVETAKTAAIDVAKAYTDKVFGSVVGLDVQLEAEQDAKILELQEAVETLKQQEPPPPSDPVAYVGMPYTVIGNGTPPTDEIIQAGMKRWIDNRSNNFLKSHLLFNWVGRAYLNTQLLQYMADNPAIPQLQGARAQGLAKRATEFGWKNPTEPILLSDGDLRNFEFKDMTFTALGGTTVPSQGLLFVSNADTGKTGSDGKFDSVEFMGAWDFGIALDGGVTANLNSELIFDQLACGNTFSAKRGLFVSGLTGDDPQEDQFLNYTFRDCKLEGSHGPYLVFNKGGSITIEGFNSWIHTGSQNLVAGVPVPKGVMLYMPVMSHFDAVQSLSAAHVRPEIRGPESHFMDCGWTGGARMTFVSLDTSANAFKFKDYPGTEDITLRNGAHLKLITPTLGGFIGLRDKGGVVDIDDPRLVRGVEGVTETMTDGAGLGMVRNFTGLAQSATFH